MEITKEDVLDFCKEEIIDRLSNDCYEWIFEKDNDVQQAFNRRLTEAIITTLLNDEKTKNQLIENIAQTYVDNYFDNISKDELEQAINNVAKNI